jgi:superfamily II DNA helicase RecQ
MQCRHFTIRLTPQHLIEDEERLNAFLSRVRVHSVQTSLVAPKGERWSVLVFFEELPAGAERVAGGRDEAPPAAVPAEARPELSAEEQRIYERLREWRGERARAEGVPPYVVAHNAALLYIARNHMSVAAAEDLAPIKQFGAQKAARYGPAILSLLRGDIGHEAEQIVEDDYAR